MSGAERLIADEPRADTPAALDFLNNLAPGGRAQLTAIEPDSNKIITRSFEAADQQGRRRFVDEHQAKMGLYYALNPLRRPLNKKATKADVEAAEWLHVEVDPQIDPILSKEEKHARLTKERARIRGIFEHFEPRPTVLVDSGGGYQGAWHLAARILCDVAETYNKMLAERLGGDHCWNVDRILRLPGTVNLPNEKKRKQGRSVAPAKVVWFDDTAYTLDDFAALKPNGADTPSGKDAAGAATTIDTLPVSGRIKDLIRGIGDPEHRYKSRSEAVFAVLVAMAGAGCDDSAISAVMLDEALPIGAHVREQRNPQRYLARQIAKGRKLATDPAVIELNRTYAQAIVGDKMAILEEDADDFRLLNKTAFKDWHAGKHVTVGKKKIAIADRWLAHPARRKYRAIVFAPGRETPGAYNLWRGFAVEPRPGGCSKFLAHLKDNICRGDDDLYKWTVGWFAAIFQKPAEKFDTSLAVRGKQGVGKTIVGKYVGSILGRHYVLVADPRYVTGRFNAHLVRCLLLHADEGFWAGDHAAEGKIKDLISGDVQFIEFKGKEAISVRNYVRLFVSGNPDWVVPAALRERRFAVLEAGEEHIQDHDYFAAITAEMNSGGSEALLHHLLGFDLSTVNLRQIPHTAALLEQKIRSLTSSEAWWLDTLRSGRLPWGAGANNRCPAEYLFDRYVAHASKAGARRREIETVIGMWLSKNVPGLRKLDRTFKNYRGNEQRGSVYELPDLATCRKAFAQLVGQSISWEEPDDWLPPPADPPDVDC